MNQAVLAFTTYDLLNPIDIIGAVVFLSLCALMRPEMNGNRLLAFSIAAANALFLLDHPIYPIAALLIALALIWFSEVFGAMRGNVGHGGVINVETPSWMVAGFGWLVLGILSCVMMHAVFVVKTLA